MQFLLIVALLFALAVAVFAVQNAEFIVVHLFSAEFETSLVVVVLAAAAAGAVMAGIVGVVRQVKSSVRVRHLQSQVAKLEREAQRLEGQVEMLEGRLAAAEGAAAEDEGVGRGGRSGLGKPSGR